MFTGLVQEVGRVASVSQRDGGAHVQIAAGCAAELAEGGSVLVSGVCLTATDVNSGQFSADVSPETVRRSSLGGLEAGDAVNLELPLRAQDRLGGHLVQGHVDTVARVGSVHKDGQARSMAIEAPPEIMRYVVEKGSVAVDGVSLTVTDVAEGGFSVSLIPETLRRTTLGRAEPGSMVNVEVDMLAKHLEKLGGARD